jgi:hypothetical protein
VYNPGLFPIGSNPLDKINEVKKASLMLEVLETQPDAIQRIAGGLLKELDSQVKRTSSGPQPTIISVKH